MGEMVTAGLAENNGSQHLGLSQLQVDCLETRMSSSLYGSTVTFTWRSRYSFPTIIMCFLLCPPCGAEHPSFPPCPFISYLFPFLLCLSFIGFTYFLLLSIPSLSTRIVPLHFQAGGRRKRPSLGLVCCV